MMNIKRELDMILKIIEFKDKNNKIDNHTFLKARNIWLEKVKIVQQLGPEAERGWIVNYKGLDFILWESLDGYYGFDDNDTSDRFDIDKDEIIFDEFIKTCSNCTYKFSKEGEEDVCIINNYDSIAGREICKYHEFVCDKCDEQAAYKYGDKIYCFDCLISKFNVEEHVTTVYYDENGEYLGSSEDCEEVIKKLCNCIESL